MLPMTDHRPTPSTDAVELPPGVDQDSLEAFVRRANAGVYDETELDGLTAAVTVIETLLDRTSHETPDAATVPTATKWASAAGYEENVTDDS